MSSRMFDVSLKLKRFLSQENKVETWKGLKKMEKKIKYKKSNIRFIWYTFPESNMRRITRTEIQ